MKLEEGMTAVVTGASKGIGIEIAKRLATEGLNLVLLARSAEKLEEVAQTISKDTGREVRPLVGDLAQLAELPQLADKAMAAFGAVDVLINNAGMDRPAPFEQREFAELRRMIDLNLTSPMLLSRAILPSMIERRRGHLVNIASVAGLLAGPFEEPYNASKFGLVGFTRSLRQSAIANDWGVGASAICPGFMEGAGIFEEMKARHGVKAPRTMKSKPVCAVGDAVISAIEEDRPEVIVASGAIRTMTAASILSPKAFEKAAATSEAAKIFKKVATSEGS